MSTIICENETELLNRLMKLVGNVANTSIQKHGTFKVGLSGGSVLNYLAEGIPTIHTDFTKWLFFFCDERVVPFDSNESTYGQYKSRLIGKSGIKEEQFVTIVEGLNAEDAAIDYRNKLIEHFPNETLPSFDLLLLGMGPDGHTCSLFPGHKLLDETTLWVAPIVDSPKPPPERITLTYPIINNAKCCIFAISGDSKAETIKRIIVDKEDLPAGRVKPTNGTLYWLLDKAAGKYLK